MIRVDKTGKARTVKTHSTLPEMTDESGKAYRSMLVELGHISPDSKTYGPLERPFMSTATVQKLRTRLIVAGLITPEDFSKAVRNVAH